MDKSENNVYQPLDRVQVREGIFVFVIYGSAVVDLVVFAGSCRKFIVGVSCQNICGSLFGVGDILKLSVKITPDWIVDIVLFSTYIF